MESFLILHENSQAWKCEPGDTCAYCNKVVPEEDTVLCKYTDQLYCSMDCLETHGSLYDDGAWEELYDHGA